MKIACFSDVHANSPALCAAMEKSEELGCRRILVAGDIVGGGPHPTEVIEILKSASAECILGNVDRKVLRMGRDPQAQGKAVESPKKANWLWTWNRLGEPERHWLDSLPRLRTATADGCVISMCHGTPNSDEEFVLSSVTDLAFRSMNVAEEAHVLLCGHSHSPFTKQLNGKRIVNAGSVGRPGDGDPRGSFAVLDCDRFPQLRVSIVRFAFPLDNLLADIVALQLPGALPEEYRRGVKIRGA